MFIVFFFFEGNMFIIFKTNFDIINNFYQLTVKKQVGIIKIYPYILKIYLNKNSE